MRETEKTKWSAIFGNNLPNSTRNVQSIYLHNSMQIYFDHWLFSLSLSLSLKQFCFLSIILMHGTHGNFTKLFFYLFTFWKFFKILIHVILLFLFSNVKKNVQIYSLKNLNLNFALKFYESNFLFVYIFKMKIQN